ncbi:P-loop containing nucleoside triphosphate hydrolase protein, partial [Mycena amicta]
LSDSDYASQRKELLGLMSHLRAVGAQAELDLPRIVVIGNQSAGKSSVVEAISGIKVPRDSGTCTRSPIECRMSTGSKWSCQVSIRREFDNAGRRVGDVSEERFGIALTEEKKDQVELMLRRAQLLVLDETVSMSQAMGMSAEKVKERMLDESVAKFSKNIVCVDLEVGPDLTDLQFIDLPGLIQNAPPDIVRLVEDMVVETISGNCLILVAIPMPDDIENQIALRLARERDPAGIRTIGVLTKPDVVPSGSNKRSEWLEILEGRSKRDQHTLHHGYYCTRQPDDDERKDGVTSADARRTEATFFAQTVPWSKTTDRGRFGTENLVLTLSTLLVEIIAQRLPDIAHTAQLQLAACRSALAHLPKPSTEDPATRLLMLLSEFSTSIRQYVRGSSEPSLLVQKNNRAFGVFKREIRATAPAFVAVVDARAARKSYILTDSEEEGDIDGYSQENAIYLSDVRTVLNRARARELPGDVPPAAKAALIADFQKTWENAKTVCFDSVRQNLLDVLYAVVEQAEYFGRFAAFKADLKIVLSQLVDTHAEDCAKYLDALLEMETQPMTQNSHYLQATTEKWVGKYRDQRAGKTPLPESPLKSKRAKTMEGSGAAVLRRSISCSRLSSPAKFEFKPGPASTTSKTSSTFVPNATASVGLNDKGAPVPFAKMPASAFGTNPSFGGSESESPTRPTAAVAQDEEQLKIALGALAQLGYTGISAEDLGKLRPADEYEAEIVLMGGVRAYFQVSYKRIIDTIPGLIDTKFVKSLASNLQSSLIRRFLDLEKPETRDQCARYLTEDQAIVAKRTELMLRMKMLEGVQRELQQFGR